MKLWTELNPEERQERLGDPRLADRAAGQREYEADIVHRFRAGLPLSLDGKRRARRIIREAARMSYSKPPQWQHDCDRCRYLGQTIGGGRITDLYVCGEVNRVPTLIARFSSDGPDYYSTDPAYASANGHSELFAAAQLYRQVKERVS
jgi:hypothetical protein